MIKASCHCGMIQIDLPNLPDKIGQCNCTLCTKTGWRGAYYDPTTVDLTKANATGVPYVQGDKTITVYHCPKCGCTTHWTTLVAQEKPLFGVNTRLFIDVDLSSIPVFKIDGASF